MRAIQKAATVECGSHVISLNLAIHVWSRVLEKMASMCVGCGSSTVKKDRRVLDSDAEVTRVWKEIFEASSIAISICSSIISSISREHIT